MSPEQGAGDRPMGQVPNCMHCRQFFVTYDPRQPRGCKAYGFKSQEFPAQVVLKTSGIVCQFFSPRDPP